jgi:hypothetical protein
MKRPKLYIATAIAIGVLLISSPHFFSSAAAKPQYVRIIIHEHRLHFEKADCLDQHLKEHLYSRLVDKELTDRGLTAFSVDAVSAIDKIIIGVEHWGEPEKLASIAQAASDGIKKRPPAYLVEQERALVTYEDSLLAEAPLLGASVTSALLRETPSSNLSCSADQLRLARRDLLDWAPGDYEIYQFKGRGQYTRISSSQLAMSTFPNTWDSLQLPPVEARPISASLTPNALFVAYKGGAEPLSTTKLLAAIYDAIAGSGLESKDVRPFGKAGFVIFGEYRVLFSAQEKLRKTFSQPQKSLEQLKNLQRAWARICDYPTPETDENVELFNERIAHTYFEYEAQGQYCRTDADLTKTTEGISIFTNLIYVAETNPEPPSYSNEISLNLCIPEKDFVREDLSIAAYALRRHLRYDVGLALNIKFSKIEGNCVKGLVFAPALNAGALDRSFTDIVSTNESYTARYLASKIIYYCSKGNEAECQKNNDAPSKVIPELYIKIIIK